MADQFLPVLQKPLNIDQIRSVLSQSQVGHTIFYYASVPSTMPIAHEMATKPSIQSGTMIVAEEQTSGRGRLQRQWLADANSSILVSLLLRSTELPTHFPILMMAAGITVIETIIEMMPALSGKCGLKWPNDIVLGIDPTRPLKAGGILIESRFHGAQLSYAIVGMGINVNQSQQQLPLTDEGALAATSLAAFTGQEWDRSTLLITLAKKWELILQQIKEDQHDIVQLWRNYLWTIGQQVAMINTIQTPHETICSGTAFDIDEDGALLIRDNEGVIHKVHVGDVSLRPISTLDSQKQL